MSVSEINPSDYQSGTIIHNHPDWKYHSAPGLSSSAVKCFVNQSPRHYQYHYLLNQGERKETDAMLLGTLAHCLVLEPDEFERRYEQELQIDDFPNVMRTVPDLKKYCEQHSLLTTGIKQELTKRVMDHDNNAPVWDVLLARQKDSKQRIINGGLWDKARRVRDGVFDNNEAASLFGSGESEVSVWGTHDDTDTLIKCRCDWLRADGLCVDLKTCGCSSPDSFAKDCARLGYALQDVHYSTTLNSAGIDCNLFVFAAVETEPPYLCQVYTLNDKSRAAAQVRYETALKDMAECKVSGTYPGYTDTVSELSLPAWNIRKMENAA